MASRVLRRTGAVLSRGRRSAATARASADGGLAELVAGGAAAIGLGSGLGAAVGATGSVSAQLWAAADVGEQRRTRRDEPAERPGARPAAGQEPQRPRCNGPCFVFGG